MKWRVARAVSLGAVFGMSLWTFLPVPQTPHVKTVELKRDTLMSAYGVIRDRGIPVADEKSAHLLMVGDMMFDRNVAARTKAAKDPEYPFRKLPENWFNSFDYAIANLEGVVTDQRRSPVKSIDFMFDPSIVATLKKRGIDAVSQANNHALDQGSPGNADSMRRLREGGLLAFGHQVDDGAISLATTTVNGIRIAFLGYNTTDNPLDREQALPIIQAAASSSDIVIAYVHWGIEYQDHPEAASIDLSHWLIDQGVDVVIGGHPHWERGFSSYKGHPIAWSLGNFIFDQDFSKQTEQGLAIGLTLRGGSIEIEPIPMTIIKSQPEIASSVERTARLEALAKVSDPDLRDQIRAGKMVF
ncbi:MAG: CapA family protein [Candidatus Uhrbacteria bacterium]